MEYMTCPYCGGHSPAYGNDMDEFSSFTVFECDACHASFKVYDMTERGTVDHELLVEALQMPELPIVYDDDDPWTWYQWLKEGNGDPNDLW